MFGEREFFFKKEFLEEPETNTPFSSNHSEAFEEHSENSIRKRPSSN